MKETIIITGTTRDLGAAIKSKFIDSGYNVFEVNHSDYNLTNMSELESLFFELNEVENVVGCINNSYADGFGQLEFLFMVADLFGNDSTKFILSLGSINANRLEFSNINQVKYSTYKHGLIQAHKNLKILYPNLKLFCESLPMCDTSYNASKPGYKISPSIVANNIFKSIFNEINE